MTISARAEGKRRRRRRSKRENGKAGKVIRGSTETADRRTEGNWESGDRARGRRGQRGSKKLAQSRFFSANRPSSSPTPRTSFSLKISPPKSITNQNPRKPESRRSPSPRALHGTVATSERREKAEDLAAARGWRGRCRLDYSNLEAQAAFRPLAQKLTNNGETPRLGGPLGSADRNSLARPRQYLDQFGCRARPGVGSFSRKRKGHTKDEALR